MAKRLVRIARPVMDLAPYKVSNQKPLFMKPGEDPLKLDWNESTISPSPEVIKAVCQAARGLRLNWYPDVEATALRDKLSIYTQLPQEYISCFGGSDMALEYIARTYLESGCTVLLSAPTYDNFRVYAQSTGATVVPVQYRDPFKPDVHTLLNSISSRTRLIYVCNPNNPTGTLFTEKEIVHLLEKAPQKMFLIDEAYYEFCGLTVASLVMRYPNIIVVRSFSKAFGLAALRIGYILSDPDNLQYIHRIKIGKNVNALAQVAAMAALKDLDYTRKYVRKISKSKEKLEEALSRLGFEYQSTPANFLLVRLDEPADGIAFLEKKGIFVRDRSSVAQLEGYVRITIGTPEQTERLIAALGSLKRYSQSRSDRKSTDEKPAKADAKEVVGV